MIKKRIHQKILNLPTTFELEQELKREKYKSKYQKLLKNTIYVLVLVVAISILMATFLFPVLRIYSNSMNPTLTNKDIVLCIKNKKYRQGDIIAFYYNNHILVKRIIATSSDIVNIDTNGNIFVNDKLLIEPYIKDKFYIESDIEYPYKVNEHSYFVLGDKRDVTTDSRISKIGSIKEDEIIGKVVLRLWPMKQIGIIK